MGLASGVLFPDLHHMPMQGFDKMVGNILLLRLRGVLDRTALGGVYARHEAVTVPRISMNLCLYGVIPFFHVYLFQPALEVRVNGEGFEYHVVQVLEFDKTPFGIFTFVSSSALQSFSWFFTASSFR